MGIFIFIVILFLIILLFSSKTLSPIPYFPSQSVDIPLIINALKLKNNQTIFDLGAGDGIVIFETAKIAYEKKINTKFVAIEINPILILVLYIKRFFHPNKKNIRIVKNDIFVMDYKKYLNNTINRSNLLTFYLYISPWFLEKTVNNIKKQISKFNIVSYMYEIKSLEGQKKEVKGKNSVFAYNL